MQLPNGFAVANAAGTLKTYKDVDDFLMQPLGLEEVTVGAATVLPRKGNSGVCEYFGENISLNSIGLKNPGAEYYRFELARIASRISSEGGVCRFNIAGFSPEEYRELSLVGMNGFAKIIELNLSCPNVRDQRIISDDPRLVREVLRAVERVRPRIHGRPLDSPFFAVKISPTRELSVLAELAKVFAEFDFIREIVCCNTIPNGYLPGPGGGSFLSTAETGGWGGIGGTEANKALACGAIAFFRSTLGSGKTYVGVGGIRSGADVRDYLLAGATKVQIGTYLFKHPRPASFLAQVRQELAEYLTE